VGVRLLRLAILTLDTRLVEWRNFWHLEIGPAFVRLAPRGEPSTTLTFSAFASVPLIGLPTITPDNRVEVPSTARRTAERVLENIANLVAVANNCRRTISSTNPCVAFQPANRSERAWLRKRGGMNLPDRLPAELRMGLRVPGSLFSEVADRPDGVALLAEALAHTHPSGKFHELVRFFEAAFALPYNKLAGKLMQFLRTNERDLGYTRDEVDRWFHEVRDPIAHADEGRDFALEATTRPIVHRMEQAAYDVLLNKKVWRSPDRQRRRVWATDSAMASPRGDVVIHARGRPAPFETQLLDAFGSYPLYLGPGPLMLPEGAWIGDAKLGKASSVQQILRIVEPSPSDASASPP